MENGGNGACTDGTMIGSQTKIGATGNVDYAYQLGYMSNKEAAAIGCNLSFAPVSDILYNWENPVIGLRTYGNDPKRVADMTKAYLDGAHATPGFCCAAKHFPGDGLDFRDQHVANSVNTMSCEEWDATFGLVYFPAEALRDKLIAKGFDVFIYESPIDKMMKEAQAGKAPDFNAYFAGKTPIKEFRENQDLIITMVDIAGGFQPVARPAFGMIKGGGEIPWYVFELPVIVVGIQQPFVLADIPQARTYINTYDSSDSTLDALIDKLMTGEEAFKGKDPVDSYCGIFDTHI